MFQELRKFTTYPFWVQDFFASSKLYILPIFLHYIHFTVMRAVFAIMLSFAAFIAVAHPVPDIPVRAMFKSDGRLALQVEIDPRCFGDDAENTPYMQHWVLKEMNEKERNKLNEQCRKLIAGSVEFRFEPNGKFHPKFRYRYSTLGGKPLGKKIDTPVVILAEWETKIPVNVRGYRIKALPKGKFSVKFVNFLDGKPQDLNVLFPGEASYELDLTKFISNEAKASAPPPGNQTANGLRSFIYFTPSEVRHEFLLPLLEFEKLVKLDRENPDILEVSEQAKAHNAVETFFRVNNLVEVDGLPVKPKLTQIKFFGPNVADFNEKAKPKRISVPQARIGLIVTYSAQQSFRIVRMTWSAISAQAPSLRSAIFTGDQDPKSYTFTQDSNVLAWKAPSKQEVVSVSAAKHKRGGKYTERDAADIFTQLLANVYGAFKLGDDRAIYDALAAGVDGGLLRSLFLQFKRSLIMTEQGGAVSRVKNVKIVSGRMKPARNGFVYDCTWRVVGMVEHWGHAHTRENEYEGTFNVEVVSGEWKITGYDLRRQKRVKDETATRHPDSQR